MIRCIAALALVSVALVAACDAPGPPTPGSGLPTPPPSTNTPAAEGVRGPPSRGGQIFDRPTVPSPSPSATTPAQPPLAAPTRPSMPSAQTRLASHLFLPVGGTRSIAGLGALLEVIPLTEPDAVRVDGGTLRGVAGGMACLRFRYRDGGDENGVQTQCAVVFDETGDCHGQPPLALDLERFLAPNAPFRGNANLLESGAGHFYAACRTTEERYRLSPPATSLPPLYYFIVDALGSGAYSLGSAELGQQRAGVMETYEGNTIQPPWVTPVSLEMTNLRLGEDGRVEFDAAPCDESPACTSDPDTVQPGDIVSISIGLPQEMIGDLFGRLSDEQRDRFFQQHAGLGWELIAQVHPDAHVLAFARLAALSLMVETVRFFDETLGLRDKEVIIAYNQVWFAEGMVPYPGACFPDFISSDEHERCTRIEEAIQHAEAQAIAALRASGMRLWYGDTIDYDGEGAYVPFANRRPHFSRFEGVLAAVGANSSHAVPSIPSTLDQIVRDFAAEIPGGMPVVLTLSGPPVTSATGGAFCEANVCPSDFKGMYEQAEAALFAAMEALQGRLQGFGVSLFEGSHFDIRDPHEQFEHFALNRVGETGYNNPMLNVYRAQAPSTTAGRVPARATPTPQPAVPLQPQPTPTAIVTRRCGDSEVEPSIVAGPSGPQGADADSVFQALAVHPTDPNVVYMGTERNGLVVTRDGGRTWTRLRNGLKAVGEGYAEIWDVSVSPADPGRIWLATLGSPGPATGNARPITAGVYTSADGGVTWGQYNCGLPSSRIVSVVAHPANPDVAVIGVEGGFPSYTGDSSYYPGGIFRTEDGGNTWTRHAAGTNDEKNGYWVMRSVRDNPWTIITFGMNYENLSENLGFIKSTDGGRTWTAFAPDLRDRRITAFDVSADGQTIYANESDTYGARISRDGGATWTQGPIIQVNGPIAVSPVDPNLVIFSSQQTLMRSTDGAQSAQQLLTAPQPPGHPRAAPFHEIEFSRSDPSVVYAVTEGYLVYRSDDAGQTFELTANVRQDVLNAQP